MAIWTQYLQEGMKEEEGKREEEGRGRGIKGRGRRGGVGGGE